MKVKSIPEKIIWNLLLPPSKAGFVFLVADSSGLPRPAFESQVSMNYSDEFIFDFKLIFNFSF